MEKATEVYERALEQPADRLGVEIDLTRLPTLDEVRAEEQFKMRSKRLLESEEVKAYLRESEQDDAQ